MHLLPKLFFGKRHSELSYLYAQTFIFERITTNEWAPIVDKLKLYTIHIFPSTCSNHFLKTIIIHHHHCCKSNLVLSTPLQKLLLRICDGSNRSMVFLWLSIMLCRRICKSFTTSFRCFLRVSTLVMALWMVVWSLASFPTSLLHWTALEDLFPWQDLQACLQCTHKQTHAWPHTQTHTLMETNTHTLWKNKI